jgi:CHAD domain-containing protein
LLESLDGGNQRACSGTENCFGSWAAGQLTEVSDEFFEAAPNESADVADLHRFRIRGKALRYSMELLGSAFDNELRETHYRTIEELQERLGAINDHVTACDRLRNWAADTSDEELREMLCRFAEHEVARLTAELATWREWWSNDRIEQIRQGLARPA